jgi:hypothetical protein
MGAHPRQGRLDVGKKVEMVGRQAAPGRPASQPIELSIPYQNFDA